MKRETIPAPVNNSIRTFISGQKFSIPEYQRRYDWSSEQITEMWDDLVKYILVMKNQDPILGVHYFGNSIIYENDKGVKELVDGQQRTLTFAALIAAFRDFFTKAEIDDDGEAKRLLWKTFPGETYIYSTNTLDNTALQELLNPAVDNKPEEVIVASLSRLHKAYKRFYAKISEAYQEELEYHRGDEIKAKTAALQWYFDIIDHSIVSSVTSNSRSGAFIMFKTLNNRGLNLSASDVVKIELLDFLKQCNLSEKVFTDLWAQIDVDCKESGQNIGYMLGDYYKARTGNMISSAGLIKHWEELLNPLAKTQKVGSKLAKELALFSAEWSAWFFKRDDDQEHNDLVGMRVSNQYAPLLAAYKAKSGNSVTKGLRTKVRKCIEYVHIHAKLAGLEDANTLKKTYVQWAAWMYRDNNPQDAINLIIDNAAKFKVPNVTTFKTNLKHNDSLTTEQARFLLRTIEVLKESGKKPSEMTHVEHIVPKAWRKGDWDHIKWNEHENKLNNLGNLTLLEEKTNMSIGNGSWAIKEPEYRKSTIKINKEIIAKNHQVWNDSTIVKRCDELAGFLYEKLKLPNKG